MKKIRNWLLLAIVIVMTVSLAACTTGSGTQTAASSAPAATEKPAESTETKASEAPSVTVTSAGLSGNIDYSKLKVAVALGWMENESGWRQKQGYDETLKSLGVLEQNITYVDANYDVALQTEQIASIIQTKPDLLFCVPANADGLAEAIQQALDAGIPVFLSDGTVYGEEDKVTGQVVIDNYSGGYATMEYLAKKLDYKGNVALIKLDPQPAWKPRSDAAIDVCKKYPGIKIVAEWSWDSTGVNTPRMAMDSFLAQFPNKGDLDAVWCAWDTACMECIEACEAAGRTEILFAGFDGGEEACNLLLTSKQFVVSIGPCIYLQAYTNVMNAVDYLNGKDISAVSHQNAKCVLLEKDSLSKVKLKSGEKLNDYDLPGKAEEWGLKVIDTVKAPA